MNNRSVCPAFVLGGGVNALGIIRSLGRQGIPVYLFSSGKKGLAHYSRYTRSITLSDPGSHQAIISDLFSQAQHFNDKPVLFYASDDYLEFVSKNREQLSGQFLFSIASRDSVECVSKKEKFGKFCAENNIEAPASFTLNNDAELMDLMNRAPYPLIIKPSKSLDWQKKNFSRQHGLIKIIRAEGPEQLLAAWNRFKGPDSVLMAQEFIPGDDSGHYSYYSYRNKPDGEVTSLCVRKRRVLPIHGGAGTFFEPVENAEMQAIARDLLDKLDYTGIASVCFKWNSRTDSAMVHEINGRMPQGHMAFQMCGIDLPYIMYLDLLGEKFQAPAPTMSRKLFILHMDLDALIGYRRAGELGIMDWLLTFGARPYCAEFAWDDWKPFLFTLKLLLQRLGNRIGTVLFA
jgi:predicted ATP-grasp superfamily ATP-dependent carboligase